MKNFTAILLMLLFSITAWSQVTISVDMADKKQTIFGLGAHADDPHWLTIT